MLYSNNPSCTRQAQNSCGTPYCGQPDRCTRQAPPARASQPGAAPGCGQHDTCLDNYPIAMAYVPWQVFHDVYPLDRGFHTGTIFPCLDLPFMCASPVCLNAARGNSCGSGSCMRGGRS